MGDSDEAARAAPQGGARRADLMLFAAYLALYAGFMGLAAFAPEWLARRVFGGLNLALVYGLGLIGAAVVAAGVALFVGGKREEER
jgi:uncharacterized membrane protein (DUF485 family)